MRQGLDYPRRCFAVYLPGNSEPLTRAILQFTLDDKLVIAISSRALFNLDDSHQVFRSQGLDAYLNTMKELAREMGAMSEKFEFAEGWRRHNPLGLCDPDAHPRDQP